MTDSSKIAKEILTQMYAAADPPLDFQAVLENPEEFDDDWYQQHTLCKERQSEIMEEVLERHNLSETERTSIMVECRLSLAPSSPE